MIEFEKNVNKALSYDREKYLDFLDEDFDPLFPWYGVSFQLPRTREDRQTSLTRYLEAYEGWFKEIVEKLDIGLFWIVNHDDKDLQWLPNHKHNLTSLRNLFKERNIPNKFTGALLFTKNDLFRFSKDLLLYPLAVFDQPDLLYNDLDISHSDLPFIIKIRGHGTIDLFSSDEGLLKDVIKSSISYDFILKPYRGTAV